MDKKTSRESEVRMTELVLPNDTNLFGNLLGGRLMHWVDIAGALAATRHARSGVATVQVDSIDFKHPIRMGEMVELYARVTWVGKTSMEVKVCVFAENLMTGESIWTNEAFLVFVALDQNQNPVPVPGLLIETEKDQEDWNLAVIRRDHRIRLKAQEKK